MKLDIFKKVKSIQDQNLLKPFLDSNEALKDTIKNIKSENQSLKDNYSRLITLADVIRGQKDNYEGGFIHFIVPTEWQKTFSRYMMNWYYIPYSRYLFNEWSDIAEEGMNLLSTLISENNLENYENDERFNAFYKRFESRLSEVRDRKGNEFLNDNGW